MRRSRPPKIAYQPAAHRSIQRGASQVVRAIRPTLGPSGRVVAVERKLDGGMPEIIDGGALLAQRIVQLANPHEDVGAMLVRELVARVGELVGDGTSTAAVLFERVLSEGLRYLAAGGDSVALRRHLIAGAELIAVDLDRQARPIGGEGDLTRLAMTHCHDDEMAAVIGEILDIVGEYGRVEVRSARHRGLEREYVEGMYWDRGVVSRWMLEGTDQLRTEFTDASILVSDLDIGEPRHLLPIIEAAVRTEIRALLLVVGSISESALAFLRANVSPDGLRCVAVKTPGWGKAEQAEALSDLAVLTGGRVLVAAAGDSLASMDTEDFGHARRVWASQKSFGIVGGAGSPRLIRQHLAELRASLQTGPKPAQQDQLEARIGKLLGGSATLWVGGTTELEADERLARAKRTVRATKSAVIDGVVPGGGIALLEARSALDPGGQTPADPDAAAATRILGRALGEPFLTIASNSGLDGSEALARLAQAPTGHGLDARTGQVVEMAEAGILDSASVLAAAVRSAVSSAALALSVEVLVLRSQNQPTPPAEAGGGL